MSIRHRYMLWSKQFFFFDGDNWLDEHHSNPLHTGFRSSRNSEWFHMGVFQVLWVYYGLLIESRPVIVWNTIAVVINLLSVRAYRRFARAETDRATHRA